MVKVASRLAGKQCGGNWAAIVLAPDGLYGRSSTRQLLRHVPIHNQTQIAAALTIGPDNLLIGLHMRSRQRMLYI